MLLTDLWGFSKSCFTVFLAQLLPFWSLPLHNPCQTLFCVVLYSYTLRWLTAVKRGKRKLFPSFAECGKALRMRALSGIFRDWQKSATRSTQHRWAKHSKNLGTHCYNFWMVKASSPVLSWVFIVTNRGHRRCWTRCSYQTHSPARRPHATSQNTSKALGEFLGGKSSQAQSCQGFALG